MTVCECAHLQFQPSVVLWCWRNWSKMKPKGLRPWQRHHRVHLLPLYFTGTVMTPNYVRSLGISLSPWCDCSSSGNSKPECQRFAELFANNRCLRQFTRSFLCMLCFIACCCVSLAKWYQVLLKRWFKTKINSWVYMDNCVMINIFLVSGNAIQAFGNGTDVGVWQPQPPIEPTAAEPSITGRNKDQTSNALDALTDLNKLELNGDSLYHICGTSQVKLAKSFSVLGVCIHNVVESGSRGPNGYTTSLYCPSRETNQTSLAV